MGPRRIISFSLPCQLILIRDAVLSLISQRTRSEDGHQKDHHHGQGYRLCERKGWQSAAVGALVCNKRKFVLYGHGSQAARRAPPPSIGLFHRFKSQSHISWIIPALRLALQPSISYSAATRIIIAISRLQPLGLARSTASCQAR